MSRLHRRPLRELVSQIVSGAYAPGERLPREQDLAASFHVSRGVIREVLRALEERGLITVRHGIGAVVAPRESWRTLDGDVLPSILRAPDAGPLISETIQVQRLLEGNAVALAAERMDDRSRRALERAMHQLREVADEPLITIFRPAVAAVHRTMISASRQRALGSLAIPISAALATVDGPETVPSLARVVDAVLAGRPANAQAGIQDHLSALERRLVGGG
jgi:GntR family transcriptional repressor for pyruvate dehydrogenase complex